MAAWEDYARDDGVRPRLQNHMMDYWLRSYNANSPNVRGIEVNANSRLKYARTWASAMSLACFVFSMEVKLNVGASHDPELQLHAKQMEYIVESVSGFKDIPKAREQMGPLMRNFSLAIIHHREGNSAQERSPLVWLTMGICITKQGTAPAAQDCSVTLAAMTWCIRLLWATDFVHREYTDNDNYDSFWQAYLDERVRVLINGPSYGMPYLAKLLAIARAAHKNANKGTKLFAWNHDNTRLCIPGGSWICFVGLQKAMKDLILQAWDRCSELLFYQGQELNSHRLDLTQVYDPITNTTPGWHLATESTFPSLIGYMPLAYRLAHEPMIWSYFYGKDQGDLHLDVYHTRKYLRDVECLLGDLALLLIFTGGQCSRGTELPTIRWRNAQSGLGGQRGFFVHRGLVSSLSMT